MKLTHEQLGDWFFTANPSFAPEARSRWLAMLETPPKGAKKSEIVSGMKQGINDTLTMAKWLSVEDRKKIEEALAARGLPSLRKMDAVLKKKHLRILARGHIKNDEEYYIIAEILSDLDFEVSKEDRSRLSAISNTYETRSKTA